MKSSLATKMAKPGGRTVAEAVAAADAGLARHRAEGERTLCDLLAWLEAACAAQSSGTEARIYEMAAGFLDLAGFFDTGPLYEAAFSLCEVSDRMLTNARWDWPSIDVHVRAMRLILRDNCKSGEASQMILEGLASVARRIP